MREIPYNPPITEATIEVSYRDRNGLTLKRFSYVQELAEFLKSNDGIAKLLGYVPKKSKMELSYEEQELQRVMRQFINANGINRLESPTGQRIALEKKLIEHWSIGYVLTEAGKKYLDSLK